MRAIVRAALLALAFGGLAAPTAGAEGVCNSRGSTADLKSVRHGFEHDGVQRGYRVYRPEGKLGAVVFVLHGAGGSGAAQERIDGGSFARLAARERFLLVLPDGLARLWNDGRGRNVGSDVDDVGFLTRLLAHVQREHGLAQAPAYVAGMSNGGMMALRLACDAADQFRAAAAVVATMTARVGETCRPSRPIAVAVMNGTADPLIPYDGGDLGFGQFVFRRMMSTADTIAFWARVNDCRAKPLVDSIEVESFGIVTEHRAGCADGTQVMLVRIERGGHTWPGGLQYLPANAIGPTVHHFDGSAALWAFFQRAGRRSP
jgi:polyhydroxybutyrate depolymerase